MLSSRCGNRIRSLHVGMLKKIYRPLPMIIFGIASIISGILALALPETHNQQLPETLEEAESFGLNRGYERLLNGPRNLPTIGSTFPRIARRIIEEETRRLISV